MALRSTGEAPPSAAQGHCGRTSNLVATIVSRAQLGLHAPLVHVEVNLGSGLPTFTLVGLPAAAVKESKERVRAALLNSGFEFPAGRITVNLAPADVPKEGGRFDLPIALGILLASGQIRAADSPSNHGAPLQEFYGELGLTGELRPVKGLLLAAAHAAQNGHELIVPRDNADEVLVVAGCVRSAVHLRDVCEHLKGTARLAVGTSAQDAGWRFGSAKSDLDLQDVKGQAQAKRALVVAASGSHSLLMVGPPGAGKSMLAQRLPGLLPPLTDKEALEVATIASVSASGFDRRTYGLRPFRSPHHTSSAHAIVGGGPYARPGEVSLAHHGVLFLDELPEFERRVLESLREPLETGRVSVSRARFQTEYPASFQLVAAMNPCHCGRLGDPAGACRCTPPQLAQYRSRISGPLLDRIDLRVELTAVTTDELCSDASGESSAAVAVQVHEARARQLARSGKLNAQLTARDLPRYCRMESEAEQLFWQSHARFGMSARSCHRALRVARTIADINGAEIIQVTHVAEALQLKRALSD
jgi:magnesium chelatase family protein